MRGLACEIGSLRSGSNRGPWRMWRTSARCRPKPALRDTTGSRPGGAGALECFRVGVANALMVVSPERWSRFCSPCTTENHRHSQVAGLLVDFPGRLETLPLEADWCCWASSDGAGRLHHLDAVYGRYHLPDYRPCKIHRRKSFHHNRLGDRSDHLERATSKRLHRQAPTRLLLTIHWHMSHRVVPSRYAEAAAALLAAARPDPPRARRHRRKRRR